MIEMSTLMKSTSDNKCQFIEDAEESMTSCTSSVSSSTLAQHETDSNDCASKEQNIRVVARLRPLSNKEINEKSKASIKALQASNSILVDKNRKFDYDAVFGPDSLQKNVYDKTAGDLIHNIFKGFNVTVLAYGQTGSGKTHTIFGQGSNSDDSLNKDKALAAPCENDGIIPRAVFDVFETFNNQKYGADRVKVEMSYLEIYNEEARDLLNTDSNPTELHIRESKEEGVIVQNLSLHQVKSPLQVAELMESASQRRVTGSTAMNAVSSRSHAICTLYVTISGSDNVVIGNEEPTEETKAKLTLVDLAGSERIKRTGAEGARMKEGININKGLFVLGQVVSALSELGQHNRASSSSASGHIKYRDSKLTRLLQDSLGGNSKTVMVACVSPADSNLEESINTLRYAERTRSIKNSAVRNVVATSMSPAEAAALRRENQMLKLQLFQVNAKLNSTPITTTETRFVDVASSGSSIPQSILKANDESTNEINGVNIENLALVTKLKLNCSSMQAKIDLLEEKAQDGVDDVLAASLRADKWQIKCEELMETMKANGLTCPIDRFQSLHIINQLRKELSELKGKLADAEIDAAMSRATAAAMISENGDIDAAEKLVLAYEESSLPCDDTDCDDTDKKIGETLTAELVAMNGDIEQKEAMVIHMSRERECMEAMRSHFEGAIQTLQEEVDILSAEREQLLAKMNKVEASVVKKTGNLPQDDIAQTRKMQQRINELEKRMKELKQKASEHARSLRMREQAERKCEQLQVEIKEDKKRRTALQRKLKEEAEDRRSEKKEAQLKASKLLRDSQKLKNELGKVKEAAARQAAVLRRKVTEAISKQKSIAEQQKKRNQASAMRPIFSNSKCDILSNERKEELSDWVEREINSASDLKELRLQIGEHEELLEDAETKKEAVSYQQINESSSVLRSLESEIELRSGIIRQLENNIEEILKASNAAIKNGKPDSLFLDTKMWQGLSRPELRFIANIILEKLIEEQYHFEKLKKNHKEVVKKAVTKAINEQKRLADQSIMTLKLQHSETIGNLLESTKETVENSIRNTGLPDRNKEEVVDPAMKKPIDDLLNAYLTTCNEVGEKVKHDLKEIREHQDGMRKIVDDVAVGLITQNEANASLAIKKKKKKKKLSLEETEIEDLSEIEDVNDSGAVEDSDDSDWSPDSPVNKKKNSKQKDINLQEYTLVDDSLVGENISLEETEDTCHLEKLKVAELKEILRRRGLQVSGKKAELISRLRSASVPVSCSESDGKSIDLTSARPSSRKDDRMSDSTQISKKRGRTSLKTREDAKVSQNKKMRILVYNDESNGFNSSTLSKISPPTRRDTKSSLSSRSSNTKLSPQNVTGNSMNGRPRRSARLSFATDGKENFTSKSAVTQDVKKVVIKSGIPKRSARKKPLSSLTNSAKKRRRKSNMVASVSKALMQLEALEQTL